MRLTLIALFVGMIYQQAHAQLLRYKSIDIVFPVTVKEAYQRNQMGFKPPGWYYKTLTDSVTFSLEYAYERGDFNNEYQPVHVLFSRELTGYGFDIPDKPDLFEKELAFLKELVGTPLRVTLEEGSSSKNYVADKRKQMPALGNFRLAEGKTKDGITVFLREIPRLSYKQKPLLQVFFFKGISSEKMKIRVHAMD